MKLYNFLYIFIFLIISNGCKWSGDVLATYDGGKITRGELYDSINEKNLSVKAFGQKKIYQKKELKMIAVDKIAITEAKKANFDKSERFKFLLDDVKKKYLGAFLIKKIINEKGFNEKVVDVSHIVLKLNDNSKFEENRVLENARGIISKIKSGQSFEKLANTYSEDISRTRSGKVGFILYDMFPKKYADAAFSLKKGKFTETPVFLKKRRRVFIIKSNAIQTLTPDTINKIIPNRKMRMSYQDLIEKIAQKKYIEEIKNTYEASYDKNLIQSNKLSDVIFKIKNIHFTVADLNERYDKIIKMSNHKMSNNSLAKEKIAQELFSTELLKMAAISKGIDKNDDYIKKMNELGPSYLAGEYMEYKNSNNINITLDEMLQEYKINKKNKYYELKNINGKRVKHVKPFNSVKNEIENSVRSMKIIKAKARWIDLMLEKYNYKVIESELEGI